MHSSCHTSPCNTFRMLSLFAAGAKSGRDPDHTTFWRATADQIARVPASGDPGPGTRSVRVPRKHYTTG